MNRKILKLSALAFAGLAGAAILAYAAQYGADNFSAKGRLFQPAPTGHLPGKDNGAGEGLHNAGEDCGICHRPNGKAANFIFTVSGTLYKDRPARNISQGGEVILEDIGGNVISMTSNAAGNFWSYASLASNPYTIANHGVNELLYTETTPADPQDSRTWQYKAWVKNDGQITPMITIAPVGNALDGQSRMSCNMHHAAMGSRGGLWASRASTLQTYPESNLSFKKHMLPIFRSKCVPCHLPGTTNSRIVTKSDIETPATIVDYSNGQDFTSYSGSTVGTVTKKGIKDFSLEFVGNPEASPLLTKTLETSDGVMAHGGGSFWSPKDADYKAIRNWIAEGAKDN